MIAPGPVLETLTHRLVETPSEFLAEPRVGASGLVCVPALVNDVLRMHGARAPAEILARFDDTDPVSGRNRLALVMIACWLLTDDWFVHAARSPAPMLALLDIDLRDLAAGWPAQQFVRDSDRREELARVTLARLGLRPEGESVDQATDRLSSVSGSERRRLLEAARDSHQRARAIRAALTRKAAQESADKWTRE